MLKSCPYYIWKRNTLNTTRLKKNQMHFFSLTKAGSTDKSINNLYLVCLFFNEYILNLILSLSKKIFAK